MKPQLWVFAGPNGAGKSTLVQKYEVIKRIPVVNPDSIAREPGVSELHAGRFAIEQRTKYLEENRSFGIETTLSGRSELKFMQEAKARDYKINLIYIGLAEWRQSKLRVISRVEGGGHNVPEHDISRRYKRSIENLTNAIQTSDRVRILDNSGKNFRLLLSLENGKATFINPRHPEWAKPFTSLIVTMTGEDNGSDTGSGASR
jgi:predicted ABC-type ATPase